MEDVQCRVGGAIEKKESVENKLSFVLSKRRQCIFLVCEKKYRKRVMDSRRI